MLDIASRRHIPRSLLALLALASGVALVAIVGQGLVRGAREAHDRAEWSAVRDARELCSSVRAALRQPTMLDLVDPLDRFAVEHGLLVVDAEVGWLSEVEHPTDTWTSLRLQAAQLAEFAAGDRIAAERHYDQLLERGETATIEHLQFLAAAAWQAHRAGAVVRTAQLAERLDSALSSLLGSSPAAALGDCALASALSSCLLLAAARKVPIDARQLSLLPSQPPQLAVATLHRLTELGLDASRERTEHDRIARRRSLLRGASQLLREAADRGPVIPWRDGVALWFPDGADALVGQGAIVPKQWLATLPAIGMVPGGALEEPSLPRAGRLVYAAGADTEPLVEGVAWIAPVSLPELPWFARPSAMLLAGVGLLLVFAASAWATLRGLSRETAAMRTRAEFLASVTHELKTPVASMRLIADVLHDDDVPAARQREYFAMLAGEAARLSALVDNVLDLGQMERGERAYDLRQDDAADLVREVVRGYAPLAGHGGLTLTLDEGASTARVAIDRGACTQALLNLFENARKYAAAGQRIDVHTLVADGTFEIRVRDHGPGIAGAEREAIFTRFRRGLAHQNSAISGVGLGLFLARSIVERHGGTLRCTAPDDGPGAMFVCTLPLCGDNPT